MSVFVAIFAKYNIENRKKIKNDISSLFFELKNIKINNNDADGRKSTHHEGTQEMKGPRLKLLGNSQDLVFWGPRSSLFMYYFG
jgi:hypothetical protein